MGQRLANPEYSRVFPSRPQSVREARHEVAAVARRCGIQGDQLHAVELSVTEIVTNAIVHAYGGRHDAEGEILVEVFVDAGDLEIVVADDGPGVAPRVGSPGLGLGQPVVASLAQSLELGQRDGGGAEVRMVFSRAKGASADGA